MHVCTRYNMEHAKSNLLRHVVERGARVLGLLVVVVPLCQSAWAQSQEPGLTSLPSAEQVIQRSQDPFSGSIPQGKATPETIDLTIDDALDKGLKFNLGLYLSDRATDQSRASRLRALSDLMPVIHGSFAEDVQKVNLKSFGFTGALIPGIPTSIGPFSITDLRATGSWNPLDLHLIDNVR